MTMGLGALALVDALISDLYHGLADINNDQLVDQKDVFPFVELIIE